MYDVIHPRCVAQPGCRPVTDDTHPELLLESREAISQDVDLLMCLLLGAEGLRVYLSSESGKSKRVAILCIPLRESIGSWKRLGTANVLWQPSGPCRVSPPLEQATPERLTVVVTAHSLMILLFIDRSDDMEG